MAERPASRRADLATALADLARGDTATAEAEFERVLAELSSVAETAAHEAAEAARNIANLALLSDIDKAIRYYRRACDLEPEYAETWRLLGHACLTAGDTGAAREALSNALGLAKDAGDTWSEMASEGGLGDVATVLGDLDEATGHYAATMELAAVRCRPRPGQHRVAARPVGEPRTRSATCWLAQGDRAGALAAYRGGLAIRAQAGAADPGQHRMAARPVGEPRQDRRRAAQRRATWPARSPPTRRASPSAATLAERRPGQHAVAARPVGEPYKIGDVLAGAGRPRRGARPPTARRWPLRERWPRATRPTRSGSATCR